MLRRFKRRISAGLTFAIETNAQIITVLCVVFRYLKKRVFDFHRLSLSGVNPAIVDNVKIDLPETLRQFGELIAVRRSPVAISEACAVPVAGKTEIVSGEVFCAPFLGGGENLTLPPWRAI